MGEMISYVCDGGTASGYLATPAPDRARGRGVVVIQEWWGLVDHIKEVTDRFAAEGFLALAPDLYHGEAARSPDEAGKLMMALEIARAERDLRGAAQRLRFLTGRKVGTVGFCMGGTLSLYAACAEPEAIAACVVYYGGHPKAEPDYDQLKAPVLGHWAEDDESTNAHAGQIEEELRRRGLRYEFHRYPGTRHAFFNDERPAYDRDAAEASWERTVDFLARTL
jgi:carboxymethylenebutenolidase